MIEIEDPQIDDTPHWSNERDESSRGDTKKAVYGTALVVFLLPVLYGTGLLSSGYRSKHITYSGFSSTDSGTSIGSRTVHLREGQTFVVNYSAEIEKGDFNIFVKKAFAPLDAPAEHAVKLVRNGQGRLKIPIRETALYTIYTYGSPRGGGYDITYTLSWRPE